MTNAELERTIEEHVIASAEDLADEIYEGVKIALEKGDDREQIYRMLRQYYDATKESGLRREHRAAGIVLSYLDGYCSPIAAL